MPQARQNKSESSPLAEHLQKALREGALFIFGFLAVYFLLALTSYHPRDPGWTQSGSDRVQNLAGPTGAWLADVFFTLFGYLAFLFPLMVAYVGWLIYIDRKSADAVDPRAVVLRSVGFILTLGAGCGLATLHDTNLASIMPVNAGGILGDVVGLNMQRAFSFLGATLLMLALFLSGVTLFVHLSWIKLMDITGGLVLDSLDWVKSLFMSIIERLQAYKAKQAHKVQFEQKVQIQHQKQQSRVPPKIESVVKKQPVISKREIKERQVPLFKTEGGSALPPLSILDEPELLENPVSREALEAISRQVELKLADFGVEVEVVAVHPGPVITRYEMQPAAGVKVSQITNLAKDLARALSAISVRIVDVIPGKTTIGLEIPNEFRETVRLSEIIKSTAFEQAKSPLTLGLGKDIGGHAMVADLARMPHLLVAGTTGAGKSVALNAMILSLLYNARPEDVRMIMIDPKMLELSVYEGIPHLLAPVVTDMKEAANALRWCVFEMDRRYKLMSAMKVRNITGFNKKVRDAINDKKPILDPLHKPDNPEPAMSLTPLPYIVVVVDELADMMMVVGKKVEELIARLAQKARASGIHLILATQRPSVDVLTGLIKSNIPCRIAFQVSSRIDSRTILDQMGAEQLLGHGDMLYLPAGTALPTRIHGAFVDDHEVHKVVDHLKSKGEVQYEDAILNGPEEGEGGGAFGSDDSAESDPLYDDAVRIVTETRKASISGVQRRLRIGYNRAARMVEAMEMAGVVGPLEGNGMREVLAPPPPKN